MSQSPKDLPDASLDPFGVNDQLILTPFELAGHFPPNSMPEMAPLTAINREPPVPIAA